MLTVYGIKNCDTVKKTLKWLVDNGFEARLHDYRQDGLDAALADKLIALFPLDEIINKRSTTWRDLDEVIKNTISPDTVTNLLQANPTLIKRPIVLGGKEPLLGFDVAEYARVFKGE